MNQNLFDKLSLALEWVVVVFIGAVTGVVTGAVIGIALWVVIYVGLFTMLG